MSALNKVGGWGTVDNFDDNLVSDNEDNEENAEPVNPNKRDAETAGLKDVKVGAVKKQRKARKKLDPQLIASDKGIWELIRRTEKLGKLKGKHGTEVKLVI